MWNVVGVAAAGATGALAWAVRGKSSACFGPSVYRGPRDRKSIALTFDDGPTPATPALLEILRKYSVPATFFQCGVQVRRHPTIVREVLAAGHELGNHTDTHPLLALKSPAFIHAELAAAQQSIADASGIFPRLFRPPFGVRWFGLRKAQQDLNLLSVMWTTIGRDWKEPSTVVASRLLAGAQNGAILCLHDGRQTITNPDVRNTLDAVAHVIPRLLDQGFRFERVSDLLCRTKWRNG